MSEHMALTVACDVCGKPFWYSEDNDKRGRPKPVKTAVWFETEQDEGRGVKPYVETVEIDMCPECAERGIRIRAVGAMGFNEYRIEES